MNAEHYAQLIHFTWEHLGAKPYLLQGDLQTVSQRIPNLGLTGPGIYSLWIKTSFQNGHYVPTYLG
jgi:hypothetical protein